jgi:hypothetical protein
MESTQTDPDVQPDVQDGDSCELPWAKKAREKAEADAKAEAEARRAAEREAAA